MIVIDALDAVIENAVKFYQEVEIIIMGQKVTREQFLQNQKDMCKRKHYPHFMPYDGICYYCHKDIVQALIERGYDGTTMITACPICGSTYCD